MVSYRLAQGSDNIIEELKKQKLYKANMDLDTVPPSVGKHSLKNAKIMLDLQRIRGGAPQSRGYAFCEFIHHAHALACLRELNNNAAYSTHHSNTTSGGLGVGENIGGKLIVEMSLENFQKVSRCGFICYIVGFSSLLYSGGWVLIVYSGRLFFIYYPILYV